MLCKLYICFRPMHCVGNNGGIQFLRCLRKIPLAEGFSLCLYNTAKKLITQDGKKDKRHKRYLCRIQKCAIGIHGRLTLPIAYGMILMLGGLWEAAVLFGKIKRAASSRPLFRYISSFRSFFWIQPHLRRMLQKITLRMAGRTKQISASPSQSKPVMAAFAPEATSATQPV